MINTSAHAFWFASPNSAKRRLFVHAALVALAVATSPGAQATEGGANNWPNGVFDILAGVATPPIPDGTFASWVNTAGKVTKIADGAGQRSPVEPNVRVYATAALALHGWGDSFRWLGGADASSILIVPYAQVDAQLSIPTSATTRLELSDKTTALGDITVSPLTLGWRAGRLHYAVGFDLTLPTGKYDATRIANTGYHYRTLRPTVGLSYFFADGSELSTRLMYDINSKNSATQYRSGDAFHADYLVAKRLGFAVVGLNGYYFQQVKDDTSNGQAVANADGRGVGNRGRAFGLGPFVRYQFSDFGLAVKWEKDFGARYRGVGSTFFVGLDKLLPF